MHLLGCNYKIILTMHGHTNIEYLILPKVKSAPTNETDFTTWRASTIT